MRIGPGSVMNAISRMSPPHPRALQRKLLTRPGQQFRPGNPRGVVGAWFVTRSCVAAAFRGARSAGMPAGSGLTSLANIADRERRDGFSQPVDRREDAVRAMPVLPRRRHEIGQPIEKLKRREVDDTIGPRPRGRAAATGSYPVGGFVSGEHVADSGCAAVCTVPHGEPLQREGRPCTVSQQVLEALKIAGHIAVDERDPDTGVD